jgi:hypothetical protein
MLMYPSKYFNFILMKKGLLTVLVLMFASLAFAQSAGDAADENGPRVTFVESEFNFGDISQGDKVNHTFEFENTGTEPLVISNVLTTCGCTAPSWPREPIAPGEKAKIDVVFNSAGKMGIQNKVITVVSNAVNAQERVKLVGNILPKQNNQ